MGGACWAWQKENKVQVVANHTPTCVPTLLPGSLSKRAISSALLDTPMRSSNPRVSLLHATLAGSQTTGGTRMRPLTKILFLRMISTLGKKSCHALPSPSDSSNHHQLEMSCWSPRLSRQVIPGVTRPAHRMVRFPCWKWSTIGLQA